MSFAAISLLTCALVGADARPTLGTLKMGGPAKATPYLPREGDLVFFDDRHPLWTLLFLWAGTGPPLHMGIVVKLPDGKYGMLEAGPDDTIWVKLQELGPRLQQFHRDYDGGITIRRCKKELTRAQSLTLSRFAIQQDGKPYAILRLLLQGTPLRSRGPLREPFLAETRLDRWSWICSELAVAAGTVVDLFPKSVKANVTYPRDLVNNARHDLRATWEEAASWCDE